MSLFVAKSLASLGAVNGLCMWLIPEKTMKVYNAPITSHNIHLFKSQATAMLGFSAAALFTIFVDPTNISKGVAMAQIPYFLQAIRSMIIEKNQTNGEQIPLSNDLIPFLVCPPLAYAAWTGMMYATPLWIALQMLNGLSMIINPGQHAKVWGDNVRDYKNNPTVRSSTRSLGFAMTASGSYALSMYLGSNVVTALGYSWISFMFMSLLPKLNSDTKKLNLYQPAILAWVPIHMLAIVSCILLS